MLFFLCLWPKYPGSREKVEDQLLTKRIMSSLLELGLADKSQIDSLGSGCHSCDQLMVIASVFST